MFSSVKTSVVISHIAITALILLGLLLEIFVIPVNAIALQAKFLEFKGDAPVINSLLIALVAFGQVSLISIDLLIRRVDQHSLLARSSERLVSFLIYSLTGVAATFFALLLWLMSQNALPPVVHLSIWVGIMLALSAALVINVLKTVLHESIDNLAELESVI